MKLSAIAGDKAAQWGLIGVLFVSPWPNAMNAPVYIGMLFVLAALLLLQTHALRQPLFFGAHVAVSCCAVVLFWGLAQAAPVWPADLAHPAWAHVTNGAGLSPLSANPGLTFDAVMLLTAYGLIFCYTAHRSKDRRFAKNLLVVLGGVSVIIAFVGLALFSAGDVTLMGAEKAVYRGRLTGPFVNANLFASYLALGLTVLLALAVWRGGAARGTLMVRMEQFFRSGAAPTAAAIIVFAALLLTASRGGAAAALAGVMALSVFLWAPQKKIDLALVMALAGAAIVALSIAALSAGGLEDRFAASAFGSEGRAEVFRFNALMIEDRPLTGHGLGAFRDALPAYYDGAVGLRKPFLYAHNLYADTMIELGAPAAFLLFAAVGFVLFQCLRGAIRRRSQDRLFPIIALAASAAIGVQGLVDNPVSVPAVAIAYAVILGVGYGQSRSRKGAPLERGAPS